MNPCQRKILGWRTLAEVFFEYYIKARDGLTPAFELVVREPSMELEDFEDLDHALQ
jgi:hypothetical protein